MLKACPGSTPCCYVFTTISDLAYHIHSRACNQGVYNVVALQLCLYYEYAHFKYMYGAHD